MKRPDRKVLTAIVVVLVVAGAFIAYITFMRDDKTPSPGNQPVASQAQSTTTSSDTKSLAGNSTEELLLYLIEEEKLAHDVYTVMYQKYGANIFGNILESESTHQDKVLVLLNARNIKDPRSAEVGVFKNTDLQNFYNSLIEQGNKSAVEAYKAGVAIEEKDIADISAQLASATDQEVISTLELLRKGSENHLRAFNKQLNN